MPEVNPLLNPFNTSFEVAPFAEIKTEHYVPAIEKALENARREIDDIRDSRETPTFENTIESLERSGELLGKITPILFNLNSAETSEDLQRVAQEVSPQLTEFSNDVKQDPLLFKKVEAVYKDRAQLPLTKEESRLLEKTYRDFVRSGANLEPDKK